MAKICWLQLSDLHFGFDTYTTDAAYNQFKTYLRKVIEGRETKPELLFLTGDYIYAKNRNDDVLENTAKEIKEIIRIVGVDTKNVFMVPGNHDVNIGSMGQHGFINKRSLYIDDLYRRYRQTDGYIPDNTVDNLLEDFEEFNKLRRKVYNNNEMIMVNSIHELVMNDDINIVLMNTAFAFGKDQNGSIKYPLIFGIGFFRRIISSINNNNPIIILAHHPFQDVLERPEFENEFQNNNNIILYLCGHEHRFSCKIISNVFNSQNPTFMNENSNTKEPCQIGFTIGEIDTEKKEGLIEAHAYDAAFDFWDLYRQFGGNGNTKIKDRINGIYRFKFRK